MKERKVLILDAKMCEPVRKKGGGWTTVLHEFREVVEDLGGPYTICNVCGGDAYPECEQLCEVDCQEDVVLDSYRGIQYVEEGKKERYVLKDPEFKDYNHKKVLILNSKNGELVRKMQGGQNETKHNTVIDDIGRPYVMCNICKEEDYPKCQKYCERGYKDSPVLEEYKGIQFID